MAVVGGLEGRLAGRPVREELAENVLEEELVDVTGGTESVLPVPAGPSRQPERKVSTEKQSTGGIGPPQARPGFCLRCPGSCGSDSGFPYSRIIRDTKESKIEEI